MPEKEENVNIKHKFMLFPTIDGKAVQRVSLVFALFYLIFLPKAAKKSDRHKYLHSVLELDFAVSEFAH